MLIENETLVEETNVGIAARQAGMRQAGPEAAEAMPVADGQLPAFLREALKQL